MTAFPNKTTVPAPGLNKRMGLLGLDIALMILLAATVHPGTHMVSGLLLMTGCVIHLAMHGRWIKAVILNEPQNVTPALRRQRRLFWGMCLSGSMCGLSGLAMLPLIFDFHAFFALHCCATPIHILSGLTFLSLNIYHLVLHRNWFTARLSQASAAVKKGE